MTLLKASIGLLFIGVTTATTANELGLSEAQLNSLLNPRVKQTSTPTKPVSNQRTANYNDGSKYVGQFRGTRRHGYGTYTWPDSGKYVGQWKYSKRTGQGTRIYSNGSKYVGQWKDDKRHGQGAATYADGSKQVGQWINNKYQNTGQSELQHKIQTYSDGGKYVGQFKNGKRNGQGTYAYPDGSKYVGQFKNGDRNGQGTYTWLDGSKKTGQWVNNKYQSTSSTSSTSSTDGENLAIALVAVAGLAAWAFGGNGSSSSSSSSSSSYSSSASASQKVDWVGVNVDWTCGFVKSCFTDKTLKISGPGHVPSYENGKNKRQTITRMNGALEGSYTYSVSANNGEINCTGSFNLSGRKNNYSIRLYGNCSDASSGETG